MTNRPDSTLASLAGQADRLSGRYVHVLDDIRDLLLRAEEIEAQDLYALRVRKL